MNDHQAVQDHLRKLVADNDVVLFMKGTMQFPQCGFSAQVVQILDTLLPDYATVDVLQDPEIREGVKAYSQWPTIPQLYVKGEFQGGCDIVTELYESGELPGTFGIDTGTVSTPSVEFTDAAAESILQSLQGTPEDHALHLGIDARHQAKLFLMVPAEGSLRIEGKGVTLFLDPLSASRADGAWIDLVKTDRGIGFQVHLPNAPER